MFISIFPSVVLLLLVLGGLGLIFLLRFLIAKGVPAIASVAIIVGMLGMIIPILVLVGDSALETQRAILIAGSIVFGSGIIAAAIGAKKQ